MNFKIYLKIIFIFSILSPAQVFSKNKTFVCDHKESQTEDYFLILEFNPATGEATVHLETYLNNYPEVELLPMVCSVGKENNRLIECKGKTERYGRYFLDNPTPFLVSIKSHSVTVQSLGGSIEVKSFHEEYYSITLSVDPVGSSRLMSPMFF